jgi:predicted ATPase
MFHKLAYLLVSQNYIKYVLSKIEYINPLDTKPQRIFFVKDEKKNINIRDLEDVVDFFSGGNKLIKADLNTELKELLKEFGIAEGIEVIKDDRLPVKELKVKIKDLLSNITDVGYGVALQIPVLLKALLAERLNSRKNTVLLIEQPEVHLHPRLHAKFIETLLSLGNNNFYIIETHSEHIVRKLQIIVKEKQFGITSEDVSINYLIRNEKETINTFHKIEESGALNPVFPEGFFDNSYTLARELLN